MDLGIFGKRAAVARVVARARIRGGRGARPRRRAGRDVRPPVGGGPRSRGARSVARSVPIVADVSTPDGAAGFVRDAREALGGIDILVANAGGPPAGNFASTTVEQYLDAFELNCLSTIAMCYEAVPEMRERKWGRVRRDHVDRGAPADRAPDPLEHRTRRAHRVPQDARTRSRGRRRHRELAAPRPPRDRRASPRSTTTSARGPRRGSPGAARSASPTTSAGSPRSCARSTPAYVTGTATPVDGGAYAGSARDVPSCRAADLHRRHDRQGRPRDQRRAEHAAGTDPGDPRLPGRHRPRSRRAERDFAVVADFDDVAGYVTYRDDPEHQRIIAELIRPHLASRVAAQYEC